jgi:hypothetical protein
MFIRCSKILSLIFPPTVYHGQVLLPLLLRNDDSLVCSLCKRKLEYAHMLGYMSAWLNSPATHCGHSGN